MRKELIDILNASKATSWTVTNTNTEGWEFYFIHGKLDQNRVRHTEHTEVTVYQALNENQMLGSASAEIASTLSVDEMKTLIQQLITEASLVQNPYYELHEKVDEVAQENQTFDIQSIAKDFIETMQKIPTTETEDINSYEIFCDVITKRFISSTGIDVTSVYPNSMIEVVVNARKDSHEIELYRMYRSGTCDGETLSKALIETMHYGKDKLVAQKTPNLGKGTVLFSTQAATQIYRWFVNHLGAAAVYRGISQWKLNEEVDSDIQGDRVTIRSVKYLENSSENYAYDAEGAVVKDILLIENGIPKNYFGDRQFSYYLGLKDSFIPSNFVVEAGKQTSEVLRQRDYLEVVEFSDFQVNPISGEIAGEIRLAYLHQDGEVKIVSGGSVTGNMNELMKSMYFSSELKQYNQWVIPSVTVLENVSITGAE